MKREQIIGGLIAAAPIIFLSYTIGYGINTPFPSIVLVIMYMFNMVFAFFSIFVQTAVIYLYIANVYVQPTTTLDYTFKYFAIFSSGMNYFMQTVFNRFPFILNKLAAIILFIYVFIGFLVIGSVFE